MPAPTWLTAEEYEVARSDPYRAFDAAQNKIASLQARYDTLKKLNQGLTQDPQFQYSTALANFEKLKGDHLALNDQYNDLEAVSETLQEVIEVLRGDKHQLLVELNNVKRETLLQQVNNEQLMVQGRRIEAQTESVDLKLRSQETQIANLEDEVQDSSKQLVAFQNEISALESTAGNLNVQSKSLADLRQHLETTRVAQDRAIQSLEREVQSKLQEIAQHDTHLWEFKQEMSGRILTLQKKAQEVTDEHSRLKRLSDHELGTLAAQNRALNDELKSTADALFSTRKEKDDFANAAKKEIAQRKEEVQQCLSVIDLVERQNSGLEASIARMLDQNKQSEQQVVEKDQINVKNVVEQGNFMANLHMELQTTREDLYLLKARLGTNARQNVLGESALQQMTLPGSSSMVRGLSVAGGSTSAPAAQPTTTMDSEGDASAKELARLREALDAVNRQLLEERRQRDHERNEEAALKELEADDKMAQQLNDEARRQRAVEDQQKLASGEQVESYTVRFADGSKKKVDAFRSDTVGQVISRVCLKIGVREADFFYLAQSVNENSVLGAIDRFLDKNKTLTEEGLTPQANLNFKFKHYKPQRRYVDPVAHEWLFRQMHNNVISEYWPTQEKLAVELGSYEIQSVFGDFSGKKRHSYFDRVGVEAYLPVSVSAHEYDYWQERLYQQHKKRKGLSAMEARTQYINRFSSQSPYAGLTFFDVRDRENRPFLAGIGEDGMYVFSANKRELLAALRFDQLLGWERSATGLIIKKRGSNKMTVYATSQLQSKEMTDLLSEYYMMLPQDLRNRLGIQIEDTDALRASLPPPEVFMPVSGARKKPVEYASRLEFFKYAYMEHCLQADSRDAMGQPRQPLAQLTKLIDKAIDDDANLEDLDLSNCEPPLDNWQVAIVHDLLIHTMEQVTPTDIDQWREDIDLRKISVAHSRDVQQLTEQAVPNLANLISKFPRLTSIDLSFVPLDNPKDVTESLVTLKNLEELTLKGCRVGGKGFETLLMIYSVVPSRLRVLDMEHNLLTQASVAQLVSIIESDNCALTDVNLGFNLIEQQGLQLISDTLARKPQLKSVKFGGNPGGRGAVDRMGDLIAANTLTELDMSSSGLTGEQIVPLGATLRSKASLKTLDLSDNPIGVTLVPTEAGDLPQEFFSFLDVGSYSGMRVLKMNKCQLQEDAGQALASVVQNNSRLVELQLAGNQLAGRTSLQLPPAWMDMLPMNHYLEKLDLSYNNIGHAGLMALFQGVGRNRSIVSLKLDGNVLVDPNGSHSELVQMLQYNSTLAELSLCDCQMRDEVLIQIGEGLNRNRGLKKLIASNNEITVRGVSEMAPKLADNLSLEVLDLSTRSVQVSEEQYLQAYKLLIESSNVETIQL